MNRETFIPPQPERAVLRAAHAAHRELPVPAQNEIRRGAARFWEDDHPEKRRMSLMQRLASVGLGRRDQEEQDEPPLAPAQDGP